MVSSSARRILLTGGAGYVGSHTYVALLEAGFQPLILDNFSNSHRGVLQRLQRLTGRVPLLEPIDVLDSKAVEDALRRHRPVGVIHFAGYKAVAESVAQPLKYFQHNLGGAMSLLLAMEAAYLGTDAGRTPQNRGTRGEDLAGRRPTLVFSSSATVYGDPVSVPVSEDFPRSHTNPYGHTKLVIEDMLQALLRAQPAWRIGILRYFNPVGAHPSGLIGEHPHGTPNNLMPYVTQVAVGLRPYLSIFGHDYPTPDGTGVRDYIHVQDLAAGHVAALQTLLAGADTFTVNLGTGRGYSVLEVLRTFEQASGKQVPFRLEERRPGDIAECYADPSLAKKLLGWEARRTLDEMCADAWRWQNENPGGYAG